MLHGAQRKERCFVMRGFTLLELLVVLTIMATITAVAAPSFLSNNEEQRLIAASQEVINAVRFARSESIRKESHHAIRIQLTTAVSVHELIDPTDALTNSNLSIHPHDKSPFTLQLSELAGTRGVEFSSTTGVFKTGSSSFSTDLYFTPEGRPFVYSPSAAQTFLRDVDLRLNVGDFSRSIQIDTVSGAIVATGA